MIPFVAKPGETIIGLGFDFTTRLAQAESVSAVSATASSPLSVTATASSGSIATATIVVDPAASDGDYPVLFAVTGSAGSVRKATRNVMVRAQSE